MLKFKEKKEGQEFTYRGHRLLTVKVKYDDFFSTCYKCAMRNRKKYNHINFCKKEHKCRPQQDVIFYYKDLGKIKKEKKN